MEIILVFLLRFQNLLASSSKKTILIALISSLCISHQPAPRKAVTIFSGQTSHGISKLTNCPPILDQSPGFPQVSTGLRVAWYISFPCSLILIYISYFARNNSMFSEHLNVIRCTIISYDFRTQLK